MTALDMILQKCNTADGHVQKDGLYNPDSSLVSVLTIEEAELLRQAFGG